jgi:hypothetical protein
MQRLQPTRILRTLGLGALCSLLAIGLLGASPAEHNGTALALSRVGSTNVDESTTTVAPAELGSLVQRLPGDDGHQALFSIDHLAQEMDAEGNVPGQPELHGEVITTPSGLQYLDAVVGEGPAVVAGQLVTVHYVGWLATGTKFDSSRDRGAPFQFRVGQGQVIKGWDEGVASMNVGGQRRLIVPADLAYGPLGRPPVIPPGITLVFDVEVLEVSD